MFHLNHRYWFLGLHPAIKSVATLSRVQYNTIYIYIYCSLCVFYPHRSTLDVLHIQNAISRPEVCLYARSTTSCLAVSTPSEFIFIETEITRYVAWALLEPFSGWISYNVRNRKSMPFLGDGKTKSKRVLWSPVKRLTNNVCVFAIYFVVVYFGYLGYSTPQPIAGKNDGLG